MEIQIKRGKDLVTKFVLEEKEIVIGRTGDSSLVLEDQKDKSTSEYPTEGVFVAIGMKPNSEFLKGELEMDEHGYVERKKGYETSTAGVFVAGDVSDHLYRQAITASGQGCAAALECEILLQKK